jgi:hypothetical protein
MNAPNINRWIGIGLLGLWDKRRFFEKLTTTKAF